MRRLGADIATSSSSNELRDVPPGVPHPKQNLHAGKKRRRELSVHEKLKIISYRKLHDEKETLARFPEICRSTLSRMMRNEKEIRKRVAKGVFKEKRRTPLKKYAEMGASMEKFFREVREAHGAVSRGLMEAFILTLPPEVYQDYFTITQSGQDEFWFRWRRFYGLTYRRFSGGEAIHSWRLHGSGG